MSTTPEMSEQPCGGKRLFTVEIQTEVVVLADDEAEAEDIAKEQASCGGDIEWNDADYSIQEVYSWLPPDWLKSPPFGMPREMKQMTCEQIIAAWKEYEAEQPPTIAELEALGQQRLI